MVLNPAFRHPNGLARLVPAGGLCALVLYAGTLPVQAQSLPAAAPTAPTAPAATPAPTAPAARGLFNDPTWALASVPPVVYRSPFARYRALGEVTPIPWRDANDTVTRIGGWRAYAREAAKPEGEAPPATPDHRHGR